jgi:hypothetical protein
MREAYPQLFIYPDFLTGDEVSYWQKKLTQPTFWQPAFWQDPLAEDNHGNAQPDHYTINPDNYNPGNYDNLELFQAEQRLTSKINTLIEHQYGEKFLTINTWYFRKWTAGMRQGLHHDAADGNNRLDFHDPNNADGAPPPIAFHDVASILYYNDNFDGGHLYFNRPELHIKPQAGMLVTMPCTDHYIHGVTPVTSGERYISAHFWTRAKTIAMLQHAQLPDSWRHKYRDPHKVDDISPNM